MVKLYFVCLGAGMFLFCCLITGSFFVIGSAACVITYRLKISEQRVGELYAKQGRGQQFRSKQDRDQWIKKV